jgi:hypothetical protein
MNTPAIAACPENTLADADMPLRFAQRAFATLVEDRGTEDAANVGAFRSAQLRSAARRTLSVLSADDQSRLQRWLALQLASRSVQESAAGRSSLSRVDAMLATAVAGLLARTQEELSRRSGGAVAA